MIIKDAGIYDLINLFKGEVSTTHPGTGGSVVSGQPRYINIPAYQRPYRWTPDNINSLFSDYNDTRSEYFVGSAVAVEQIHDKSPNKVPEYDIVDGQQRITTLFLLNYVRYLLKREFVLERFSRGTMTGTSSSLCKELKDCYVNLIGKNTNAFDTILAKINELDDNEDLPVEEKASILLDLYKAKLCIPTERSTPEETLQDRKSSAESFFKDELLCLKYTRTKYNETLKKALCNVFLVHDNLSNNLELRQIDRKEQFEPFTQNYLDALETIFNNLWNKAKSKGNGSDSWKDLTKYAIEYADELINNISFCIVLTEEPKDANKLFEVLNDRSLEVEDLELIKNHFYKEYCTKSTDVDSIIDTRITYLDEVWTDKIFNDTGVNKCNLISYFAAVYLTGSTELVYKSEAKLKDYLEREYSEKNYPSSYNYNDIKSDFNIYFAERIILDKFGYCSKNKFKILLQAVQNDTKSIVYRTFHLLNYKDYIGVLVALLNVIISSYAKSYSLQDDNFETTFTKYIEELLNDVSFSDTRFEKIHKCAYMLWIASIKAKTSDTPRSIAKRIISEYSQNKHSSLPLDFTATEDFNLDNELDEWLNDWTYGNNRTDMIKLLQLILLRSHKEDIETDNKATVTINGALSYTLDAGDLQLDHLEANVPNKLTPEKYFLSSDSEKRQQIVNHSIGNFMILDAKENNRKNNVPLSMAMAYYSKIDGSWLIKDIKNMINDENYFDLTNQIPKENFFLYRTTILKRHFKELLKTPFGKNTYTISLSQ